MGNWDVSKPNNDGEPCEDAISRQGLLDTIDRFCDLGKRQLKEIVRDLPPVTPKHTEITLESAIDYLNSIGWMQEHDRILTESAQSVTPKQRTGHWIDEGYYADGSNATEYRCSECGEHIIEYEPDRYCRFCGAKMEEGDNDKSRSKAQA